MASNHYVVVTVIHAESSNRRKWRTEMIGALEANGLEMWRTPVFFSIQKKHMFEAGAARLFQSWRCVFTSHPKVHENAQNAYVFMSSPKLKEDRYPGDTEKPSLFFNHIFFHWVFLLRKKNVVSTNLHSPPFQASHACSGVRGIQAHFRSVRNEKNERSLWVDL